MRTGLLGAVIVVGLSGGCGSSTPKAVPEPDATSAVPVITLPKRTTLDASADGAPADAGSHAPPSCDSPDASSTQMCGTLDFAISPSTSRPRNHHVTLTTQIADGTTILYAIGGANVESSLGNVDHVPLNTDGSLSTWVADLPIPESVGGLVGEIVSGVLVVAGGVNVGTIATVYQESSYSSVLNADGSLGLWNPGPPMNEPRMHAGSIVRGDVMWVLGGFNDAGVNSDIISATVSPDGTVSAWQSAGSLPEPLSHFTVNLVGDDDVYLTGGLNQSALDDAPDIADVWHGKILPDGTLGNWVAGPPLLVAEAAHAAFVYGGYLNVCGGINNVPAEEDRCWRVPINADRTLGAWEEIASLPLARGHVHQMPVVGDFVYSVAGAIDFNLDSTTDIFIGTFDPTTGTMMKHAPRAVRPITPGPVPMRGAKCHMKH